MGPGSRPGSEFSGDIQRSLRPWVVTGGGHLVWAWVHRVIQLATWGGFAWAPEVALAANFLGTSSAHSARRWSRVRVIWLSVHGSFACHKLTGLNKSKWNSEATTYGEFSGDTDSYTTPVSYKHDVSSRFTDIKY